MLKVATYPGMSLGGEVRESISLDEDDLSDVEDEVFIRDGKHGYKFADDMNVKRPLMAPRRKLMSTKSNITTRLKNRPPCRAFCKPCCYIFAALSVLIGLIVLVVILVSLFPLPLDKLRNWMVTRSSSSAARFSAASGGKLPLKLLPCNGLKVVDVWSVNLPALTSDSPVRTLDVDRDGTDDIIFGFGTGDNYDVLPADVFCPIFMGVPPPCEGGVIALNGITGDIIWRYWTNDTVFSLHCTEDVNGDGLADCLTVGVNGIVAVIDSRNGSIIWQINGDKVYVANFIFDQNNDSVADVIASHTSLDETEGHIIIISGKDGKELTRTRSPNGAKTFFMPQLLHYPNNTSPQPSNMVVIGTGGPNSPGNLTITSLPDIVSSSIGNSTRTVYEDHYKGILTQSILVDITGDRIADIVTAMYNSTIVAINGLSFEPIWRYAVPDGFTNVMAAPAYFNDDNITDFLIVYQRYDEILNYNYTQTFIVDGRSGKAIYEKPISGSVISQMGTLSLSMESFGFDMFLFWTSECMDMDLYRKLDIYSKGNNFESLADICHRQFNTTSIIKLNALNQYDQPPGFEIYNSVNHTLFEFNVTKSPIKRIKEYLTNHPKFLENLGQNEMDTSNIYNNNENDNNRQASAAIRVHKYGSSSFRHKDNRQGIIKDYNMVEKKVNKNDPQSPLEPDYETWQQQQTNPVRNTDRLNDLPDDLIDYNLDDPDSIAAATGGNLYSPKQLLFDEDDDKRSSSNRDPRSKANDDHQEEESSSSGTKRIINLSQQRSDDDGVYDYKNIRRARNRLLHDLNNLPDEILRDTYFKNMETQLRKSKFEQRDINSYQDKMRDNANVHKIVEEIASKSSNVTNNVSSYNLWDLETEKEAIDRENGYWRNKRDIIINNYMMSNGLRQVTSVGAVLQSLNQSSAATAAASDSIDVVFVTYWQPGDGGGGGGGVQAIYAMNEDLADCIESKLSDDAYQSGEQRRKLFMRECLSEQDNFKRDFPYYSQLHQLRLGQLTVYRVRLECQCDIANVGGERCAKFLPQHEQGWSQYLGQNGNGDFVTRG